MKRYILIVYILFSCSVTSNTIGFEKGIIKSKEIKNIKIYAMNFNIHTNMSYGVNDVINFCKTPFILSENETLKCYKTISKPLNFIGNSWDLVDLRMVCILDYKKTKSDTIGYSYLDVMHYNGKNIDKRDNKSLKIFCKYIDDRTIRRSIKRSLKD